MNTDGYLQWLRTTDLERVKLPDVLEAISVVMDALQTELEEQSGRVKSTEETDDLDFVEDMFIALSELNSDFTDNGFSREKILGFRRDFLSETPTFLPPEVILETELREIAEGLDEDRLSTGIHQLFASSVDALSENGEEEPFWEVLEELEKLLERVSTTYAETTLLPEEVTLESQVTHALFVEAIERWKDSLLEIASVADEGGEQDWPFLLEETEYATRLLLAVQVYNERLQRALSH